MKILFSLIIIFVPISILAKQICLAPSGCKIEMDTGMCLKCIEVDELPIIKEEKVIVDKNPVVKIPLLDSDLLHSDLHYSDLHHSDLHHSDLHKSDLLHLDLL